MKWQSHIIVNFKELHCYNALKLINSKFKLSLKMILASYGY